MKMEIKDISILCYQKLTNILLIENRFNKYKKDTKIKNPYN